MMSLKSVASVGLSWLIFSSVAFGLDNVLVLEFDSQGVAKKVAAEVADSLRENLLKIGISTVSVDSWHKLLRQKGYTESDMNYNPPVLSGLLIPLSARGAIYGQLYKKDDMFMMDCHYIEAGSNQPINFEPLVGASKSDLFKLTKELASLLMNPDKRKPRVLVVTPPDGATDVDEYTQIRIFFDEPMNPDSYSLDGEPEGMFFSYGDVDYDLESYCFIFNVHLYPGRTYTFRVNGPDLQPFKDTSGNVAHPFVWSFSTK